MPVGVNTTPYSTKSDSNSDYSNPNPAFTVDPNLPLARAVLADPPSMESYLNDPRKTAPEELRTEVWMPVE